MIGADFTELLTQDLATQMVWEASRRCPCLNSEGYTDPLCTVCNQTGRYFLAVSAAFMAGFIGQDKQGLQALMQATMGPGDVGDGVAVIPQEALCYSDLGQGDRLHLTQVTDTIQATLLANVPQRLPYGYTLLDATIKSGEGAVIPTTLPTPVNGVVTVSVTTTLRWTQPRSYEVVRDLGRVRTFASDGSGLPRRFSLKRLDVTVRA